MATYNSDGSVADIQDIHNNDAVDGDIITIPSGSFTWSSAVTLTKNVTLQGGGMFDGGSKTTLSGLGNNGNFITWVTNGSAFTAVLSGIEFTLTNTGNSRCIVIRGIATVRLAGSEAGSEWVGGVRITNIRWNLADPNVVLASQVFLIDDWVTGVMDHCWFDNPGTVSGGTGVIDINHASAPGLRYGGTDVTDGDGNTYRPQMGQNSYAREYIWGAGPFPRNGTGITGGNGDWDAFYMEDCIFCKRGIGITNTDVGGIDKGGGRMVIRHCATWAQTGGHQWSGSGGDASGCICESYNNYMRVPVGTTSFSPHNLRGGGHVFFNERFEGGYNQPTNVAGAQFDRLQWANFTGNMIGVADGTNFFDLNDRGTISANGHSFPAVSTPADTRIGSVYAEAGQSPGAVTNTKGTGTQTYTLLGLDPNCAASKYIGFTLRNVTLSAPASLGCQTNAYSATACAFIATSAAGNPSGDVVVTLTGGFGSVITLNGTDRWELRHVNQAMGLTGGTLIPMMNGRKTGAIAQQFPLFLASIGGLNPNWCDQRPDGDWQWSNKFRVLNGSTWTNCAGFGTGATDRLVLGGKHNDIRDIANAGDAYVAYDYPRQSNTADNLRIGPDWDPTGSITGFATNLNPDTATQAYGAVYPHPLVTPPEVPTGKIISLSGDLNHGNVIIGQTSDRTLNVANVGDASLVVTSVAYTPAVFTGATSGFTVSPGNTHPIVTTFTPVAETTSNGTVTVTSNADSGINTRSMSGTGVAPAGGGGHGHGKKKSVIVRRV